MGGGAGGGLGGGVGGVGGSCSLVPLPFPLEEYVLGHLLVPEE